MFGLSWISRKIKGKRKQEDVKRGKIHFTEIGEELDDLTQEEFREQKFNELFLFDMIISLSQFLTTDAILYLLLSNKFYSSKNARGLENVKYSVPLDKKTKNGDVIKVIVLETDSNRYGSATTKQTEHLFIYFNGWLYTSKNLVTLPLTKIECPAILYGIEVGKPKEEIKFVYDDTKYHLATNFGNPILVLQ